MTLNNWFDELAGQKEVKDNKGQIIKPKVEGLWERDGMIPQTISVKVSRYNKHVRHSILGDMPIKLISADHVRSYYRRLHNVKASVATINDVKGVLVKVAMTPSTLTNGFRIFGMSFQGQSRNTSAPSGGCDLCQTGQESHCPPGHGQGSSFPRSTTDGRFASV